MRTLLTASATCLILAGTTAAAAAGSGPPSPDPSVTVHHVAPVLLYRLVERSDAGQDDEGSVKVTYTCHPGGTGAGEVFAMASTSNGFLPPTFGEVVPCDGRRHTLTLGVFRKVTTPFTPPARFQDVDLSVSFILGPGEPDIGEPVTVPVRIRYVGF